MDDKDDVFIKKENSFGSFFEDEKKYLTDVKKEHDYESDSIMDEFKYESNNFYPSSSTDYMRNKIKKRGKYKICTLDRKIEAIRLARIKTIKEASDMLEIPEKNIKRWIKNGPERKKGAGRKTMDPMMEKNLLGWMANMYRKTGQFPENKDIKAQAKKMS